MKLFGQFAFGLCLSLTILSGNYNLFIYNVSNSIEDEINLRWMKECNRNINDDIIYKDPQLFWS
jgi:hypothetical protein